MNWVSVEDRLRAIEYDAPADFRITRVFAPVDAALYTGVRGNARVDRCDPSEPVRYQVSTGQIFELQELELEQERA